MLLDDNECRKVWAKCGQNPAATCRHVQERQRPTLTWLNDQDNEGATVGRARRVYFPLASNAHSLLTGAPLDGVRRRLKMASLLHDEVFLEWGTMQIQAGATGATAWRNPTSAEETSWQTPLDRSRLQSSEFSISMGPTGSAPDASEMREVMRSRSAIAWSPTLEPFRTELPATADWIRFGAFDPLTAEEKSLTRAWRTRDDANSTIERKLPDALVRNRVLGSVEDDLTLAMVRGVHLSIDRLHASVLSSRLVDPRLTVSGFALPLLLPHAGAMSWADITELRKHRGLKTLRSVLSELEQEVLGEVSRAGEVADSVTRKYRERLETIASDTPSVAKTIGVGVAEIAVGGAIGYATAGLSWIGAIAGAAPGGAKTAIDAVSQHRRKRRLGWVSAMQAMAHG